MSFIGSYLLLLFLSCLMVNLAPEAKRACLTLITLLDRCFSLQTGPIATVSVGELFRIFFRVHQLEKALHLNIKQQIGHDTKSPIDQEKAVL